MWLNLLACVYVASANQRIIFFLIVHSQFLIIILDCPVGEYNDQKGLNCTGKEYFNVLAHSLWFGSKCLLTITVKQCAEASHSLALLLFSDLHKKRDVVPVSK